MPIIIGKRIVLREYRKSDLEHIREWVNDPEVVENLSDVFLYPHTLTQTENWLAAKLEGKGNQGFVIAHRDSQEYIGQIDFVEIDWRNRVGEIGIVIGKANNRGQGLGSEAIRLLQQFAFETLNLNKIELKVHDYNERAFRSYQKCGFLEEGRLRERFYREGRYTDYLQMGILKREYEQTKNQ
jgi:RimJ/RimL family protein N-acetyltransferase